MLFTSGEVQEKSSSLRSHVRGMLSYVLNNRLFY